jgi:hypothetical protein
MHHKLFNAEFVSGEYLNAWNKNAYILRVIQSPAKVLHKSF